jgi:hypothetical protein
MSHATPLLPARQVAHACRQLQQGEGLPFAHHLPKERIHNALRQVGASSRDRLFSPAVTVWAFLSQVLDHDHSCRQVMARLFAWLTARGRAPRSADTGAYCKARARLPEAALRHLARETGRGPLDEAPASWLWKGRVVKLVDGTGISMPDTPRNQKEYPQPPSQKPGVGFPQLRLVVVLALAVGTALDAAMGRYQGQQTGELALFRSLDDALGGGDVLLADRGFCSYFVASAALARGADAVLRLHASRRAVNFRAGRRLGPGDKLVRWKRPPRPGWMSKGEYASVPDLLTMRIVRVRVRERGCRTKVLLVATTLLDPSLATSADLADLYRARWHAELDLRAIKQALQLDVVRGQSPDIVRKEVWAHLLAYNVVRGLMTQAAREAGVRPRELSFTGALQTLNAFLPYLGMAATEAEWSRLWREMVRAVGQHRVGDRPGRYEPRAVKRRPKNYNRLNEPRAKARARLVATT